MILKGWKEMSESKKDAITARLGMWLFLFSELLLFGGLFILYATAMRRYPNEFHLAAEEMNLFFGGTNTIILLTSSLLVALSLIALKEGRKDRAMWMLVGTIILACVFIGIKYLEWTEKIHHGLYPNASELLARPRGEIFFFNLYYLITGLHGLHVTIGAIIFTIILIMIRKDRIQADEPVILENCGLYWHLVDIIWIFIFPLFYLIT
jgi:cytochrome c oxidase subunit 3